MCIRVCIWLLRIENGKIECVLRHVKIHIHVSESCYQRITHIFKYKNVYIIVTPWALKQKKNASSIPWGPKVMSSCFGALSIKNRRRSTKFADDKERRKKVHDSDFGLRSFIRHMTLSQLYMSIIVFISFDFLLFLAITRMVLYVYMVLFALLCFALLCFSVLCCVLCAFIQ